MRQAKYEYDAFISHAVEDKIPIANELCAKLERAGLRIWYSGKELGVGDSIEKTIERGLNRSRYGIVILTPTYLAKNWTIREFYTLLAKEIEEHKVILPVLYNVTLDDLRKKDLLMADRFAVNADRGLDFVVEKLVGEIRKSNSVKPKVAWFSKIWMLLVLSLVANVIFLVRTSLFTSSKPVLVSEDHLDNRAAESFIGQYVFFQIQRMASALTQCSCDPSEQSPPILRRANFDAGSSGLALSGREQVAPKIHQTPGGKMTMILVFQSETSQEVRPSRKAPEADMGETILSGSLEPELVSMSEAVTRSRGFQKACDHSDRYAY